MSFDDFAARTDYIALRGALDMYGMRDARRTLRAADADLIVMDLSDVPLISAAFIGEVARLRNRLPASTIRIVGANPSVQAVLDIVHYGALASGA